MQGKIEPVGSSQACVRCGATPATAYSFWHGSESATDYGPLIRNVTTTSYRVTQNITHHYQIKGQARALLCERCIARARLRRSLRLLTHEVLGFALLTVIAGLMMIAALGAMLQAALGVDWGITASGWWGVRMFLAILAGYAAIWGLIWAVTDVRNLGEQLAIEARRREIGAGPFGSTRFWTSKEYAKLSPDHKAMLPMLGR